MARGLADLALRRPWALLAANLAVLAAATVLAVGAPDRLGIGSLALDEGARGPKRRAARSCDRDHRQPPRPLRAGVALRVISSQVRTDADVVALRRGRVSANGRSTSLLVSLGGDDTEDQQAVQRIESGIDPGPLSVTFGGEIADLLRARGDLAHDLWKLELLMVPFVALILVGALGLLPALGPILCGATAIAGALAGLRVVAAFTNVSLLGVAPAAAIGLTLGVEAACLVTARVRQETVRSPGSGWARARAA